MTTNNDKANWLIVKGSDFEPHDLYEAVLALGKTLEEVLPIGLLYAVNSFSDRIELVKFDTDGNSSDWVTIEIGLFADDTMKVNGVNKTKEEIYAILDAHYGSDVWVHMLRGYGRGR